MAKIMKKGWKTGWGGGERQQLEINMNCQRGYKIAQTPGK